MTVVTNFDNSSEFQQEADSALHYAEELRDFIASCKLEGIQKGHPYLELQQHMIFLYCEYLTKYILLRLKGQDHQPLLQGLIEVQLGITRLLSYERQIVAQIKRKESTLKPRIEMMMEPEPAGPIYKAPKAGLFTNFKDQDPKVSIEKNQTKLLQYKEGIRVLKAIVSDKPERIEPERSLPERHNKELEEYEEENFTRLRLKKQAKKKRQLHFDGASLNQLTNIAAQICQEPKTSKKESHEKRTKKNKTTTRAQD